MLKIFFVEILIAAALTFYGLRFRKTKPQWSTALLILAVALWGLLIAGFYGWLGGG
ncbi:MAG: hypothetical protein R6X06_12415 [Gammaproteobacteria bacterium]